MEQRSSNLFLWVGDESIYIRDHRKGTSHRFPLEQNALGAVPYLPRFCSIWDDIKRYQEGIRQLLGMSLLTPRYRVLVAMPDDASYTDRQIINDFICISRLNTPGKNSLLFISHSTALHPGKEPYIALTKSCRCFCVSRVEKGHTTERIWIDIHQRENIATAIQGLQSLCQGSSLPVYRPEIEWEEGLCETDFSVSLEAMAED